MATTDLSAIEDWIQPLLEAMKPGARRSLNRKLATGLRRRQAQRIASQQNPDGSSYAPRRARKKSKKGRIKRAAMFAKLRQARNMKVVASADHAEVGYKGRAAAIAGVHQDGLVDQVSPGGPMHRYAARKLLGLSSDDRDWIADQLQEYLT